MTVTEAIAKWKEQQEKCYKMYQESIQLKNDVQQQFDDNDNRKEKLLKMNQECADYWFSKYSTIKNVLQDIQDSLGL